MINFLKKAMMRLGQILILAFLSLTFTRPPHTSQAASTNPTTWTIITDDFESGTLDAWDKVSPGDLTLAPGRGHGSTVGLSVAVAQREGYIYRRDSATSKEGYLTFWFDPNGVDIPDQGTSWIPGKSIRIADVKGSQSWQPLVGLRLRKPTGQGYRAYLEWRAPGSNQYDLDGEFGLADGWQKITLGFRANDWVAVWLNDVQIRKLSGVQHQEASASIIEIGKTSSNSSIVPSGEMLFDDVAFEIPRIQDLWVDAVNGQDSQDGLTAGTALRTIQKATDLAGPGTTVHILPGVYRETIWPLRSGTAGEPVVYIAEDGPGTAIIRGSESAASLAWTRLTSNSIGLPSGIDPTNIYYADLSSWALASPPRFVVQLNGSGNVISRLPMAREPDWVVGTEWKHHEFWWGADGGTGMSGCDPTTNPDSDCDAPWRSFTQLTDQTNDSQPPNIEAGNLTTVGNLTGATLVALDTRQGHYAYRRTIVSHSVADGRITVDDACELDNGSGNPGLGWGTKYYVEGKPGLLDNPGEWWYDTTGGRLYLWPTSPGNPALMNLEISRRPTGFNLSHRSYTTVEHLDLELFNESAIYQSNSDKYGSLTNTVRDSTIRYANRGIQLGQGTGAVKSNITDGFSLEDSEVSYIDTHAILLSYWWNGSNEPDLFDHAGIVNTTIKNNEFHHLGFRSDSDDAVGAVLPHADKLRFEGNYVHHVAHNGIQFSKSIIQSPKTYGFDPSEIKTGEILIKDNVFEKACQLTTDCGALKFWGDPPDGHVFRDVLVIGNIFRNTFGWSYVSEKRGRWSGGVASQVQGMGGKGLSLDMASGIHTYRNIAYNNAYAGFLFGGDWRNGDMVFFHNIAANSLFGFYLDGPSFDTHGGSTNTQLVSNIVLNNEGYGILISDNDGVYGNLTLDHNLYHNNGWRPYEEGGLWKSGAIGIYLDDAPGQHYQSLGEIQAGTPWEDRGSEGDPHFQAYDVNDHNMHDGSWPDFHLTAQSDHAIDRGTTWLPTSLTTLLTRFGVKDSYRGAAYDIGRYEFDTDWTKTADILLVADHVPGNSNPYISFYTQALDDLGRNHDVWDTGLRGAPPSSVLSQYTNGIVIWSLPGQSGYLQDASVQSRLQAFLDAGGRLFISGQDVARMTNGSSLLRDYLHATYEQDASSARALLGVARDPIGDGISLQIVGGDGASNQTSPDTLDAEGPAWPALYYDDGTSKSVAALRVHNGTYKVVYLAFGFEGIDSRSERGTVMRRSLDWLAGSSTVVQIDLAPGWNLNSWPIEPLDPAVAGALRAIEGRYCRVLGESGVYDCRLEPQYWTLNELPAGRAYYLQVGGAEGADLWMEGTKVPVSTPLPLHEYWNWTGYLPETPLPVATALERIEGKYLMVHSIDKTYNPSEPIYSTLTQMEPGQGYLIRATRSVDLVYPNGATSAQGPSNPVGAEACGSVTATPFFSVIFGEITIGAGPAPEGTVVEVFDPSGGVAGCSVVRTAGHYGYMHLYGMVGSDLPAPSFQEGDALSIRVNGAPVAVPADLTWANDPTPYQVDLEVVRHPAHLPLVRGGR